MLLIWKSSHIGSRYKVLSVILILCFITIDAPAQQTIDRKALVHRHTVINNKIDTLSSLTIGNGRFAFTVDITGLQSFPQLYENGIPLGTQSEWGWDHGTDTVGYRFEETFKKFNVNGRAVNYAVQDHDTERKRKAAEWFRQNPHRIHLGTIGLELVKKDGSIAKANELKNIHQTLNLWTGEIHSVFTVEGTRVEVYTLAHQEVDAISARIISPLMKEGRLRIRIRFPSPTAQWTDRGTTYSPARQSSIETSLPNGKVFRNQLQTIQYFTVVQWTSASTVKENKPNDFSVTPAPGSVYEITTGFFERFPPFMPLSFEATRQSSLNGFERFWTSGGAIDFSACTDSRANELERRVVLSQYLTKIQCAGNYPPQETGLTYNSWYGRPHLEMHWWHGVHFSLWNRHELLEPSLDWYTRAYPAASQLAARQGYAGVRWQKMTDNYGNESPSSIGSFLIWQQPHPIYFAELSYRRSPTQQTLKKFSALVFATADFLAGYAYYDSVKKNYVLGPALIPAQERFPALTTMNPAFELVYWKWALEIAREWRKRIGIAANGKWDDVYERISALTIQSSKYLFTENGVDSYSNPVYRTDHPSVLGALGMLPGAGIVDKKIMMETYKWIKQHWEWQHTWGWDFPMTAMTATRLGLPEDAIDALLMPVKTNTYLNNGHNYQDNRLTLYLPGNGGLLAAIAMMCAGFDGNTIENPGFPKDGKWKVKWEGINAMP